MAQTKLLESEAVVSTSIDGRCVLTNMRIYYSDVQFGKSYFLSILLKNISSIEISYKSNIFLVVFAAIIGIASFFGEGTFLIGVGIAAFLVLLYFLSRRHFIVISSNGGDKLKLLVKGMSTVDILRFHNQIEQAIINDK